MTLGYAKYNKISDSVSQQDVDEWYETNSHFLEKVIPNEIDFMLIQCPVEVKVYDNHKQLIAALSDHDTMIDPLYQHLFFTCTESVTASTNSDTRAKILILPHDSDQFTYDIIGIENGLMNICSYNVTDSESNNWCNSANMAFHAENLEVKANRIYNIERDGSRYGIRETHKYDWKKIAAIIIIVIVVVILLVLIIKLSTRKKKHRY